MVQNIQFSPDHYHLLDNIPTGICVIDRDYRVKFWNRCLAVWASIPEEEAVNNRLSSIYPHFNEPKYKARIDATLSGGPPAIFSCQLHGHLFPCELANGKFRIVQTTVSGIRVDNEDKYHALFAVQDFTDLSNRITDFRMMRDKAREEVDQRKAAQMELRLANEKILQQKQKEIEEERLKVLLQMAGATAHELNQPLMVLLGNIQLLEMDINDADKLSVHIKKIQASGNRIADIIKKIQNIKHDTPKSYSGGAKIMDIHQEQSKTSES